MALSQPHEGAIDPPDRRRESLKHDLDAEIADHLASVAGNLVSRGESEPAAQRQALERFGNVDAVKRRCWWIKAGDEVMFRTASIVLMVGVVVGLIVLGVGGWQLQRSLGARTQELSEQLSKLTETQQAMLAQQRAPEIAGTVYLGDRSVPAKNLLVRIWRFNEPSVKENQRGEVVRVVETDAVGRFQSGPLPMGDYCVLAPLQQPKDKQHLPLTDPPPESHHLLFADLQSLPIYLYAGARDAAVNIDVLASSEFRFHCDEMLQAPFVFGDYTVGFYVSWGLHPGYVERFPAGSGDTPANTKWPLPGPSCAPLPVLSPAKASPWMSDPNLLTLGRQAWRLPPREYHSTAELQVVLWKKERVVSFSRNAFDGGGPLRRRVESMLNVPMNCLVVMHLNVGESDLKRQLHEAFDQFMNPQAPSNLDPTTTAADHDAPEALKSRIRAIVEKLPLQIKTEVTKLSK